MIEILVLAYMYAIGLALGLFLCVLIIYLFGTNEIREAIIADIKR